MRATTLPLPMAEHLGANRILASASRGTTRRHAAETDAPKLESHNGFTDRIRALQNLRSGHRSNGHPGFSARIFSADLMSADAGKNSNPSFPRVPAQCYVPSGPKIFPRKLEEREWPYAVPDQGSSFVTGLPPAAGAPLNRPDPAHRSRVA